MPRLHPNGLMIPITQIFPHKTDKVATFCAEYKHELDRSPLKFLCSTVRVLCRLTTAYLSVGPQSDRSRSHNTYDTRSHVRLVIAISVSCEEDYTRTVSARTCARCHKN